MANNLPDNISRSFSGLAKFFSAMSTCRKITTVSDDLEIYFRSDCAISNLTRRDSYFCQDKNRSFASRIHLRYEVGHVASLRVDGPVLYTENDSIRIAHVLLAHVFNRLASILGHVNGYWLLRMIQKVTSNATVFAYKSRKSVRYIRTLIIPGKSTRTIRWRPGPFTVIDMTSGLTVLPSFTLFFIRSSTSRRSSASSDSFVRSNSRELSLNCAMWYGPSLRVTLTGALVIIWPAPLCQDVNEYYHGDSGNVEIQRKYVPWKYPCLNDHLEHRRFTWALVADDYHSGQMISSRISTVVVTEFI